MQARVEREPLLRRRAIPGLGHGGIDDGLPTVGGRDTRDQHRGMSLDQRVPEGLLAGAGSARTRPVWVRNLGRIDDAQFGGVEDPGRREDVRNDIRCPTSRRRRCIRLSDPCRYRHRRPGPPASRRLAQPRGARQQAGPDDVAERGGIVGAAGGRAQQAEPDGGQVRQARIRPQQPLRGRDPPRPRAAPSRPGRCAPRARWRRSWSTSGTCATRCRPPPAT